MTGSGTAASSVRPASAPAPSSRWRPWPRPRACTRWTSVPVPPGDDREHGVPTLVDTACRRRAGPRPGRGPGRRALCRGDRMTRRILLVAHPRRTEALHVARDVVARLVAEGIQVALMPEEAEAVGLRTDSSRHRGRPGRRPPATASWSASSAATARSCAARRCPGAPTHRCSGSTSATSASWPRPSARTSAPPSSGS